VFAGHPIEPIRRQLSRAQRKTSYPIPAGIAPQEKMTSTRPPRPGAACTLSPRIGCRIALTFASS
jgi:hypothetical protein